MQLEYVQTQARKYKLMSKRKHHSQPGDGFKLEEELLKLTKAKALQEAEIKAVRANVEKLNREKDALAFTH